MDEQENNKRRNIFCEPEHRFWAVTRLSSPSNKSFTSEGAGVAYAIRKRTRTNETVLFSLCPSSDEYS